MHSQERNGEKFALEILQEEDCHGPVWKVQMHSVNTITIAAAKSQSSRSLETEVRPDCSNAW